MRRVKCWGEKGNDSSARGSALEKGGLVIMTRDIFHMDKRREKMHCMKIKWGICTVQRIKITYGVSVSSKKSSKRRSPALLPPVRRSSDSSGVALLAADKAIKTKRIIFHFFFFRCGHSFPHSSFFRPLLSPTLHCKPHNRVPPCGGKRLYLSATAALPAPATLAAAAVAATAAAALGVAAALATAALAAASAAS